MLDAARFVPQSRPRLFIVGVRDDNPPTLQNQQTQEPSHSDESDVRPRALAGFIRAHPHIRWAVRDLPPQPTSDATIVDILEDIPEDSAVWWSYDRAAYLLNQMSPRHRAVADTMIADQRWSYGTVFRRVHDKTSMAELRTDGLAGRLRTPRGGSGRQILFKAGYGRQILFKAGYGRYAARLLTPRECARLMGADEYVIDAPWRQALFGFGDAVCAPVIAWIAEYYLNPIVSELMRNRALS